jgi:hypothetical protein
MRKYIERILRVFKRKFKILTKQPEYSFRTQIQLILALIALFNFISDSERSLDSGSDAVEPQTSQNSMIPPNPSPLI